MAKENEDKVVEVGGHQHIQRGSFEFVLQIVIASGLARRRPLLLKVGGRVVSVGSGGTDGRRVFLKKGRR